MTLLQLGLGFRSAERRKKLKLSHYEARVCRSASTSAVLTGLLYWRNLRVALRFHYAHFIPGKKFLNIRVFLHCAGVSKEALRVISHLVNFG